MSDNLIAMRRYYPGGTRRLAYNAGERPEADASGGLICSFF